jgi:hypothetical protein
MDGVAMLEQLGRISDDLAKLVKRPGFAGGSDPTEGWADASTEEVSV